MLLYTKKLFYISRCYRYEASPKKGRQRDFLQFGVEMVTTDEEKKPLYKNECIDLLKNLLEGTKTDYDFIPNVKRGLSYYIEDGFEVECKKLGTQKQAWNIGFCTTNITISSFCNFSKRLQYSGRFSSEF